MPRPSAEDAGLWRWAMRNVAPLHGRRHSRPAPGEATERGDPAPFDPPKKPQPAPRPTPRPAPAPSPPLDRLAGIDRATAERVKRGRYPVEGRLDLHGMFQADAHGALGRFVPASRAAGRRCVLVITGHGRISGGVLKAAVPRWLAEPELRRHVLAIAPAQPNDGGSGALYVLLKRLPR